MLFNILYQLNPWGTYIPLVYFMRPRKWEKKGIYTEKYKFTERDMYFKMYRYRFFGCLLSKRMKIKLRINEIRIYLKSVL